MTVRYLIDTDWVIHYLNGRDDIVRRLDELQPAGLGLSVISLAELYEGIYYSTEPQGNEQDLNDFLRGVQVIGIDEDACKIFGRERGRLRKAGQLIGDFDLLIASTGLHYGVTVLTNNRQHFERVEGLQIGGFQPSSDVYLSRPVILPALDRYAHL
jgi:tRNA(fMet)-specific endonuclease VapC